MLCLIMKFDFRYEGFSDNFIVGWSAIFKRLEEQLIDQVIETEKKLKKIKYML